MWLYTSVCFCSRGASPEARCCYTITLWLDLKSELGSVLPGSFRQGQNSFNACTQRERERGRKSERVKARKRKKQTASPCTLSTKNGGILNHKHPEALSMGRGRTRKKTQNIYVNSFGGSTAWKVAHDSHSTFMETWRHHGTLRQHRMCDDFVSRSK